MTFLCWSFVLKGSEKPNAKKPMFCSTLDVPNPKSEEHLLNSHTLLFVETSFGVCLFTYRKFALLKNGNKKL